MPFRRGSLRRFTLLITWGSHTYNRSIMKIDNPGTRPTFFASNNQTISFGITIRSNKKVSDVQLRIATCASVLFHQVVIERIVGHHADVYIIFPGQKVPPSGMDMMRDRIINCAAAHLDEFGMVVGNGGKRRAAVSAWLALAMAFLFVC